MWYPLELDIDFATQTAYVDGVFLGEGALAVPTTALSAVQLGGMRRVRP